MAWPKPFSLSGKVCSVVPLAAEHADDLAIAADDGALWKLWYTAVPKPDGMAGEIARRLKLQAVGSMLPFAVVSEASGRAVGMTTYMNIEAENRRLEIGSTWYAKSVQRTGLNTECKFMLLRQAFEVLDCIAVEFRTHVMNRQSRAGIERLGAKLDGIIRNHRVMPNGTLRDTAVYSIIKAEWPVVKVNLETMMDR